MNQLVRGPLQAHFSKVKLINFLTAYPSRSPISAVMFGDARRAESSSSSSSSSTSVNTDFRPSEELAKERYDSRANEDIERKRARLLYQSRKRGMLENGVILASFADKFLQKLDAKQLDQYDRLINLPTNDWDIFYWATRTKPTPPEFETPVMDMLREHLNSKVSNNKLIDSVLGKTNPDEIVEPILKKDYSLDVDLDYTSLTNYKEELFDNRVIRFKGKGSISLMTEWRKKHFERRLRRKLSSPTSLLTLKDEEKPQIHIQRAGEKHIAGQPIEPKNLIDTPFEREMKHHKVLQHILGPGLTDDPIDYDDETEAWTDMLWHRNYGSQDDRIMPSMAVKCISCQAPLHCCDPGLRGYMPREILRSIGVNDQLHPENQRCQRCKFANVYNVQLSNEVDEKSYTDFLATLPSKESSIICVLVDLTDFPGSVWNGLVDLIGHRHKLIVVGNKLDLLPYDGYKMIERVRDSLRKNLSRLRFLDNKNLHLNDVAVISARTGFGVEGLLTRLFQLSEGRKDIYLVGCNNTGKSTLFDALLQSDLSAIRTGDILSRVAPYTCPATKANMLKFPIDLIEEWQLEIKKRRRERVERNSAQQERTLEVLTRNRQATVPHMSCLINRLNYEPIKTEESDQMETVYDNQTTVVGSELSVPKDRPKFSEDHPLARVQETKPLSATEEKMKNHKFLYKTPSASHPDQLHDLLTLEERLEVFPHETIFPRKFSIRPLSTIFIAGLARLDLLTSQSNVMFTIFASKYLPIHVIPTKKADHFYQNLVGTPYLGVPIGVEERSTIWPDLMTNREQETNPYRIRGPHSHRLGTVDIVLSSIGWALVQVGIDQECLVKAYTPNGRGIFLRDPPLLAQATRNMGRKIRDTPLFSNSHYITETRSGIESMNAKNYC